MKLDWQFSKDGRRAAAVYPLMVSDNRAGTRAEIRLRADDTGRWEIEIAAEFGTCRIAGKREGGINEALEYAALRKEWVVGGCDISIRQSSRDGANRFAAELAEEEMEWDT